MPIITPAYPSMCATHNITMSTKTIIVRELGRGGDIADKIFTGQLQWKDLFTKHDFFTKGYKYYLSIVAGSRSKDAQHVWSGLVESKVRLLVSNLETQGSIQVARPFNKGFHRTHVCTSEEEIDSVISGDLNYQAPDVKVETTDTVKDPKHIAAAEGGADCGMAMPNGNDDSDIEGGEQHRFFTTTYYIGIELAQGQYTLTSYLNQLTRFCVDKTKRLDISYQTKEFKEICVGWQSYNPEQNSLSIIHTRK